ncbi:uncharacterized protein LOC133720074 isoform X3 [Rosa rugosa]|uniref:uncharacterized protein LOC133720074 isoform X3 n=1 Tax=Rosa rugosa TaxID=74645 RepID=UPI002B40CFD4|nr:uncharacterized protein LOC133720074 isoform X3 [Rosa rugosa]
MAPSKTKAASRARENILKALRVTRARSAPTAATPTKSSASEHKPSPNRAISLNVRRSIAKKKRKSSKATSPIQTGLKLLKRGCVTMHRIVRRKILGIKQKVMFNKKGSPYGAAAKEMQSYIGVLARTKAPIWRSTWKQVPRDRKNKIWQCVEMAFEVPLEARRMVLSSASHKWREFKSKLTTQYIIPHKDEPELLEYPPADYNFIEKAHWDIFVADRLSDEFMEVHKVQKKKREKNKYPHRMSRKGYANLEAELSESVPESELDRATMWIKARQDKHGNFKDSEVEQKATEIDKLKKQVSDGEVTTCGTDDVLTKALGIPEHHGRVRGVGGNINPSSYFNLPKHRRKTVEERIREGCKKFIEEETEKIVARERAIWAERLMRVEAKLYGTSIPIESPPTGHLTKDLGSGQGSCSNLKEKTTKQKAEEVANPAKKRLELVDDIDEKIEEQNGRGLLVEVEAGIEVAATLEVAAAIEHVHVAPIEELRPSECKLALGSVDNIVAIASVVEVQDDKCANQTVHGHPLGEGNVRVSIIRPLVPEAKLPFPVNDEIVFVKDAVGTYIAWPRDLILQSPPQTNKKQPNKAAGKGSKKRKRQTAGDEEEYIDLKKLPKDYPSPLKCLWLWGRDALADGKTISFMLTDKVFGINRKQYLYKGDIHALCTMSELSGGVICMYMCYLHEVLKKAKMSDMVGFVDSHQIGALGSGNPTERSRHLSVRFTNAKKGQIFMLPYNAGKHWMLTVVNPEEEIIYFMDPLRRRLVGGEWQIIVENGIKIYNAQRNRSGRKSITWHNMGGIPVQQGDKDCGIFIMRYMKEIVQDKNLEFASKWQRRSDLVYTQKDLDDVRSEWARFVMKYHAT